MTEERLTVTELKRENRQLREAVECLCNCLETDESAPDPSAAREVLGRAKQKDEIRPPWEREGYDNKDEWIDDKRGQPDHAQS